MNVNGGPNILMNRDSRQGKRFPKKIQSSVAADEANHMVFPFQWLRQWLNWRWVAGRETQWNLACRQTFQRSLASKFAVSIASIVQRLKLQRALPQSRRRFQFLPAQELLTPMIVELFYHPVAPGLFDRDKDRLHSIVQTHPNQFSHSARMGRAAIKCHLIINLLIPRKAQPMPDGPKGCHRSFLASGHWFNGAATGRQIYREESRRLLERSGVPTIPGDDVLEVLVTTFRESRTGVTSDGQAIERLTAAMSTAEAVSVAYAVGVRGQFLNGGRATPADVVECLAGAAAKDDKEDLARTAAVPRAARRQAQRGPLEGVLRGPAPPQLARTPCRRA